MPSRIDWPTDAWRWWLSLLVFIGLVAIAFVSGIAFFIFLFVGEHVTLATMRSAAETFQNALLGNVVVYPPICIYLAAILPLVAKVRLADLGFRRPTGAEVRVALAAAAAMWALVALTGGLIDHLYHHEDTEAAVAVLHQARSPLERVTLLFIFAGVGPICEELVFRVFIFNAISRYANVATAAILSGVLFGLIHVAGGGTQFVTIALPLAVGGIVLAYVYATTRNYWASVITHGAFNATNVLLYFIFGIK